ncbi:MAG: DUF998 domain-containing protein [Candidatus Dormibacterales bacterium]
MRNGGVALIAVGLSVGVPALILLHVIPTGLSPVRNPVSQYGITRFKIGYRIQTLAYGFAGIGAALGIASLPRPSALVVALCGLFAVTRAAISWFPMDIPGAARTDIGRRHGQLATSAFLSLGVAAAGLSRMLDHRHAGAFFAALSGGLAAVMSLALASMAVDRRAGGGYFGLAERAFYVGMTAWLVVVAVLVASK